MKQKSKGTEANLYSKTALCSIAILSLSLLLIGCGETLEGMRKDTDDMIDNSKLFATNAKDSTLSAKEKLVTSSKELAIETKDKWIDDAKSVINKGAREVRESIEEIERATSKEEEEDAE